MDECQIMETWTVFKEYLDKKQIDIVAEKYIDLCTDHGASEHELRDCLGSDTVLDKAINQFLSQYEDDIEDEDDDEDY